LELLSGKQTLGKGGKGESIGQLRSRCGEGRRERRKEKRLAVVVVVVRSVNLGFSFVRWDFLVCGG
jgi:hypothetical protein